MSQSIDFLKVNMITLDGLKFNLTRSLLCYFYFEKI